MSVPPVTLARPHPASKPNGWWGMLLLIATEAALFATLVAAYFYLRFKTLAWPPDGIPEPAVLRPALLTGLLAFTSLPMGFAASSARRGSRRLIASGLGVALLLGAGYLVAQADLLRDSWGQFRPQDDAYASLYYTLNGAHAAHVAAVLLLNAWLLVRLSRGSLNTYRSIAVQATALLWHFVNALAVVILLTVVSPSL